jgi:PAS domain S-box-containing protein
MACTLGFNACPRYQPFGAVNLTGDLMREGDVHLQALLDAMPAAAAILGVDGTILAANEAWGRCGCATLDARRLAIGGNLLDACERARGTDLDGWHGALEGIREVLWGRRDRFDLEHVCADEPRWFVLRVVHAPGAGAVVSHTEITDRKLAARHASEAAALRHDLRARKGAEAILQERSQRLAVLSQAAEALLANRDPVAFLDYIYRRLSAVLALDAYMHFRVGSNPSELVLVASHGLTAAQQAEVAVLPLGHAVCGNVALQRAPIILSNVDASTDPRTDFIRALGLRAYACHPLIAHGELLGTLSFGSRTWDWFSAESVALIRAVCDLVATALGRRRSEEALMASERRFREMADTAPAMLWISDAAGACTFLSRGWYDFTGQTEATGLGSGWTGAVHPDDKELVETQFQRAIVQREAFQLEYRVRRRDGEYRWAIDAAGPRLGVDGAFLGFIGSVIDITERKQAETALKQREQDLATAFRVNPQPMFIVRASDQRYVDVNEPFERLTGFSRDEAIGRTSVELGLYGDFHDRSQFYVRLQRHGKIRDYDFETRHRDGTLRKVAVSAEIAAIGGEPCVIGAVDDVTERRQIEAERARLLEAEREARREAERANRIKDEFLATVSHELRTPLNAMLGWSHILSRRGTDPEVLQEGLRVIERNARAQAQLIADLLDMSRIVSGKLRLDLESVDLHEVADAAMETVTPTAQTRGIRVRRIQHASVGLVQGDPQRLQQAVWNLLSNAVKFTPRGGEVVLEVDSVDAMARICVSDSGQGIAPDLLPYIFDRFRQADGSTTRRHAGLGLGLSIVKQLVELHGGTVHARSAGVGSGAAFTIELPLLQAQATLQAVSHSEEHRVAPGPALESNLTLTGLTVLAVDDEPDALSVVRRLLEEREAQVLTATSADEALTLIACRHPDVLLSDIGMPGVDGYELIRRIRASENGTRLPAAALTAYARSEDRALALDAGYQAHLAKPLQPAALVETVALLAGRLPAGASSG